MLPDINSIKTKRLRLGLKQRELAKMSNVSQSLIAKLESSKTEPSYSVAKRIFSSLENLEHRAEKSSEDIMTKTIIKIGKNDSVKKAAHLMKFRSVSQLPVMEGKRAIGSISESSILDMIIQGIPKEELFEKPVSEIMKEPFPIVRFDMPISIVLPLLKSSEAILVSKKGNIAGIITKANSI